MQMDSAGYADGMNGYQAYRSNPLSFLDPMGTTSGHLGGMQGSGGITLLPWYPGLDFPPPELLPHFMPPDGGLPTPSAIISDPPPPQAAPSNNGQLILFQAAAGPRAVPLPSLVAVGTVAVGIAASYAAYKDALHAHDWAKALTAIFATKAALENAGVDPEDAKRWARAAAALVAIAKEAREAAEAIVDHAIEEHPEDFPDWTRDNRGNVLKDRATDWIEDMIEGAVDSKIAADGRKAIWDAIDGVIVIIGADKKSGTVFKPSGGKDYYDRWPSVGRR